MKKTLIISTLLTFAAIFLTGCETDIAFNPQLSSSSSITSELEKDTPTETITSVQHHKDLKEYSIEISSETADELLALLNGLNYDGGCCDGLPEYTVLCADGTRFDINLSGGWAWLNEKESSLSEESITEITALFS